MIRTVFFDFSKEQQAPPYQFGGYEHEHNATKLEVKLPAAFTSSDISYITFDFQTSHGETVIAKGNWSKDTVSIELIQQLTCAGTLLFQVVGRTKDKTLVAKTAVGRLTIEKSPYGDQAELNEDHYRVDDEIKATLEEAQELLNRYPLHTRDITDGAVTPDKTDFAENRWTFGDVEGDLYAAYSKAGGSVSTGTIFTPGGGNYLLYPHTIPAEPSIVYITMHGDNVKAVALSDLTEILCTDYNYSHGLLLQVPPEYYEFEMSVQPPHSDFEETAYYTVCSVQDEKLLIPKLMVEEDNILDGAITMPKLGNNAVTTEKLADGAVTMPKLGNDVTTQIHKALSTKVINSLPADAWAILGDWKTVSFGVPGVEMEWSEWKYAQQGPLTLSGTRFDDLVLLFDLDYDDNDGYNSIDKIHGEVEIECFSSLDNGSQKTHTLSGRFYVENGRASNIRLDLSKLEREGNPDIGEIGCLRFMVTDYLLTGMNSNLYFKNVRITESLENRLLIMPSRDSGGDGCQEYIWAQNKWELLGYLSNESVTTEKIVDGAVTMPKLGTDVKEALSAAIKREIVDFLPPINGTVIGGRTEPFTSRSIAGQDLVSTNWFKLKSMLDLTPVTSSKQIQMTVTLNRLDGQTGSYRNGEIRLRNENDDGNKVSYSLNNQKWHDGENLITAKLSSFASQSSPAWGRINEVTVFTYANDSSASYTITVSDLRIVDSSIQTDIEPNTIYMVKSSLPQEDNVYDEYMFINEAWEQIGSTAMDLSGYYTKMEADAAIADIAGVTVHDGKFTIDRYNGVERQYIEASSGRYFMLEDGTLSLGAPDGFGGTGYTMGGQTVPEYVKCDGKLYKVTAVAPDAFAPSIDGDAMSGVQSVYILPRTVTGNCSSAFNIHMSTSYIHPDFHVTVIVRSPTMRLNSLENDPYFTVLYQDDKRIQQTYAHKDDYYTKSEIDAKVPRMVSLTAAEYEALDVKDPDTLYLVG